MALVLTGPASQVFMADTDGVVDNKELRRIKVGLHSNDILSSRKINPIDF